MRMIRRREDEGGGSLPKTGLLLGLLATDDRLTELTVFALIKIMSEMEEDDVKEISSPV